MNNISSTKTTAYAYDRISDKAQEAGRSLEYQSSHAALYADRAGLEVVKYFTVIESARGVKVRKTFNEMIDTALATGVKDLIFKNTDRMSRNYRDLLRIEELVEKHGFNIHFYQTHRVLNKKSTYADKFILAVEIAAARQLSDKLSHDATENHRFRASRGLALKCPIGYRYDREKKQYVIDAATENFVRFAMDTFDAGGYSIRSFAAMLNEKGYRTARGGRWYVTSTSAFLLNPFYHGEFIYRGKPVPGKQETYYAKDRFEERQRRIHRGALAFPGPSTSEYSFSKLLRCASCGKMLTGELKKGRYVYYMHRCEQERLYIPESTIAPAIDAALEEISFGDDFADLLRDLFRESVKTRRREANDLAVISRKISELETRLDKLLELYTVDGMDLDSVNRVALKFRQDIARLSEERKSLRCDREDFMVKVDTVIADAREFPTLYRNASEDQRGDLLRGLVECVKIDGKKAAIEWRRPFAFVMDPALVEFREVRTCTIKHPELDKLRTIVNKISYEWRLYLAA